MILHQTEDVNEPCPNPGRSVQWSQVGKHLLKDVIGHPVEVSRIEIHLGGRKVRAIRGCALAAIYVEGQDTVRGYA